MKILKILAVFLAILFVSAFLAPLIYSFAPFKFERILSRLVMVFSLIAIFSFARLRLSDLEVYGFEWTASSWRFLQHGFLFGFATLTLLTLVELVLGGRQVVANLDPAGEMIFKFIKYLFAALLIGCLEEFFFRGFLFVQLQKRLTVPAGLVMANMIYALLHFFKGGGYAVPEHPTFIDSWKVMLHLADPFLNSRALWPHVVGLFLFGIVLSYCFVKTHSLFLSIGLHAGSVFFLKVDNWFVASVPGSSSLLYGDKNLHSGVLGWFFLMLLFLILSKAYKPGSRSRH